MDVRDRVAAPILSTSDAGVDDVGPHNLSKY